MRRGWETRFGLFAGGLRLRLRGERFEQPTAELNRLVAWLTEALQ